MSALLLPLGVGLELIALAGQWPQLSWFAAAALAGYFTIHFRRLLPYPRILGLLTVGMLLAVAVLGQGDQALWGRLASSGAYYASFLGALGLMQLLAKRLPHLRELHKALLAGPAIWLYPRYVLTSGSIGSILNFGMMSLLCGTLDQHLRQYSLSNEQRREGLRAVLVTTLRGFALVPLVAPTSVTIAMITREMPQLSWATMVPYGLLAALLLLMVGWRRETRGLLQLRENIGDSSRAAGMGALLMGSLLGLTAIGVLAWLTVLTPSQAAMILIPVGIACYLLWCERSPRRVLSEISDNLITMHNEMFIFGCAALMGGALGAIAPLEELALWLAQEPKYNMLLAVGSLFGIILLAMAGVAPIVSLSLLVGLLAELARLGVPIMTPALGLMCGFSIAMIFSPFGPSTLILARYTGENPLRVAFVWNGRFVISALPLLLLLLFIVHWLQS
ncbi:hypothetical protein QAO71_15935 [Halopseudomonas sp. SMJS2]|uniref:hypothetical protein n=1 Tax=Halopseudomonas sp. SMJS2 TaxID=3041098 RepID=UPI0024528EC7|nr:hypothetical protein [Halopseudomonas sp. SMJS2]WGK61516.1 hypothetical protein QAO71_15935 [Halopseudomonas sp. SMJS2]